MFRSSRYRQGSLNSTPSKSNKYDNYTPRKRYVKDQEQLASYQQNYSTEKLSHSPLRQPLKHQETNYSMSNSRNLSASRRLYQPAVENQQHLQNVTFGVAVAQHRQSSDYELPQTLQDCTNLLANRQSLRRQQLKKNCQERQSYKRIVRENENDDYSNRFIETRLKQAIEPEKISTTPRRLNRNKENQVSLTQKMTALQNKIARLERMTPQRPATPRSSRITENYGYESSVILFDKEETQISSTSQVSERENQILSRVSLGRLVEEQQCQNEIEMIQDLSYKISTKLKSIIRNFS